MKKKKGYPYIVVFIIALLVLVIAYFIRPEGITPQSFLYNAILNFGFIIVTIVIVNGLWFVLGGNPLENSIQDVTGSVRLLSDGVSTGIQRYFFSNAHFSKQYTWIEIIEHAKKNIDMMGYSLHAWTKNSEVKRALVDLAMKDVQIRIMVMDKDNPFFEAGFNYDLNSFTKQSMTDEVNFCLPFYSSICSDLPPEKQKNIQLVTITKGFVEAQIIRIDETMYITPYLYSLNTDDCPLFELKNGGTERVFRKYIEEFNMLWKKNSVGTLTESSVPTRTS